MRLHLAGLLLGILCLAGCVSNNPNAFLSTVRVYPMGPGQFMITCVDSYTYCSNQAVRSCPSGFDVASNTINRRDYGRMTLIIRCNANMASKTAPDTSPPVPAQEKEAIEAYIKCAFNWGVYFAAASTESATAIADASVTKCSEEKERLPATFADRAEQKIKPRVITMVMEARDEFARNAAKKPAPPKPAPPAKKRVEKDA